MITIDEEQAGTRSYRTTLAALTGIFADGELAGSVVDAVRAGEASSRMMGVAVVEPLATWPELELQLCSSAGDDAYDADLVHDAGISGDSAATYWTRPAATQLGVTETACELLGESLDATRAVFVADSVIVRTTPLGDKLVSAALTRLGVPAANVPVVCLKGIPVANGELLATAIRDELDELRYGPITDELASVRYIADRRVVVIAFPAVAPGPSPMAGALRDLGRACGHLRMALTRIGPVAAVAVEARVDVVGSDG